MPQPGSNYRIFMQYLVAVVVLVIILIMPFSGRAEPPGVGRQVLTLSDAFQLAWKENASLKVSRLQELIAEQERIRARAGFFQIGRAHV